ncbi:MAG: methyltransferase domain-containing protein [Alphaproteobacteria bacterium]
MPARGAEPGTLAGRIAAALDDAGKRVDGPDRLRLDDLAPVDEFHLCGPAATAALIARLDPAAGMHVLDAGCGLGGPARRLAQARGCRVTGVDLDAALCAAGNALSAWTGLDDRVALLRGDVTDLAAFADAGFDAAWSLHVGMNVADKHRFYREIARVLRPGARFVLYDVVRVAGDGPALPVPWARRPAQSHLATEAAMAAALQAAGFAIEVRDDWTERARAFLVRRLAKPGLPPLGLHLVVGDDLPTMLENLLYALGDGRVRVAALTARRTDARSRAR